MSAAPPPNRVPPVVRPVAPPPVLPYQGGPCYYPQTSRAATVRQAAVASCVAPLIALMLNLSSAQLDPNSRFGVAIVGFFFFLVGLGLGGYALWNKDQDPRSSTPVVAGIGLVLNALILFAVAAAILLLQPKGP